MTLRLVTAIFFLISVSFAQTLMWSGANNDLQRPVQTLGAFSDGSLLAGAGSAAYRLDSSGIWVGGSNGIPSSNTFQISAFGASRTAWFIAFNTTKTLYRSTDQGMTWNLSVNGLLNPFIKKIVSSGDTVLALPVSGFYRSTDNGETWALARNGLTTSGTPYDLLRLKNGTLFVAAANGLYRSTDNASQWNQVGFFAGIKCSSLAEGPDGAIFTAADTTIYRSDDLGATWKKFASSAIIAMNLGMNKMVYADSALIILTSNVYRVKDSVLVPMNTVTNNETITDIAVTPDGSVYAASALNAGVYRWNAKNKTWEHLNGGFGTTSVTALFSDRGADYAAARWKGIFSTTDQGMNWNLVTRTAKVVRSLYHYNTMLFALDSLGLFRSSDNGVNWQLVTIVPGKLATAIVRSGNTLYAGVQQNGVYASTDSGATWQPANTGIEAQNLVALMNVKGQAVIAGTTSGLFRKPTGSNVWSSVGSVGAVMCLSSTGSGTIFTGTLNGIYRSTDEGVTWSKSGNFTGGVISISPTLLPPMNVASALGGTYLTTDDGASWNLVNGTSPTAMVWNGSAVLTASSVGISYGTISSTASVRTKRLNVGSLQNWFADIGSEPEEYRSPEQQDGWMFPAIRPHQDMQASKGLWIGFNDPNGPATRKKVLSCGPRGFSSSEFTSMNLSLVSAIPQPVVNLQYSPYNLSEVLIDEIDSTQRADRMIRNEVITSAGLVLQRTIRQFSQQFHDNYVIAEYTLTNANSFAVDGVYLYMVNRWAINAETRYVFGNATGWGANTMLDVRGDGQSPAAPFFAGNKDNDIRAIYGWHGKYPAFTAYDNIGGPVFVPYYDKSDTVGRLGATQFVGTAVLHADHSAADTTDDPAQPSTMSYESSDGPDFVPSVATDTASMARRYSMMTKGRSGTRHADVVGPNGDPSLGTSGGNSAVLGFGPYTLGPGESVRIVLAEAAAGIGEAAALEAGKKFKAGTMSAAEKNALVYTGRDSLFTTFRRALANFHSEYMIPQPPRPPKSFTVASLPAAVSLKWTVFQENDPRVTGFDIYRSAGTSYAPAVKVHSSTAAERSWNDSTAIAGVPYFYYIVSVGKSEENSGVGATPPGRLESSRYYTQTNISASVPTGVGESIALPAAFLLEQNYPNPFNPVTTIRYAVATTGHVSLTVYDMIGREVVTAVNDMREPGVYTATIDASHLSSGLYFYRMDAGSFHHTKKMIVLK